MVPQAMLMKSMLTGYSVAFWHNYYYSCIIIEYNRSVTVNMKEVSLCENEPLQVRLPYNIMMNFFMSDTKFCHELWTHAWTGEIRIIIDGSLLQFITAVCDCCSLHLHVHYLHTDCGNDSLSYQFSTGECVETCPCGMFSFYGSCQPSK